MVLWNAVSFRTGNATGIIAAMRDIDLKSLRLFVAVCDHQNMARAAEQEHIEPSADQQAHRPARAATSARRC